jgi:hydroxyacylglutathione hydrolase
VTAAESGAPGRAPVKTRATIVPVTPFQQNCTLVWNEADNRGAIVDPGGDLANIERGSPTRT